mgnify:CR=1 FL=1
MYIVFMKHCLLLGQFLKANPVTIPATVEEDEVVQRRPLRLQWTEPGFEEPRFT